MFHQDHSVYYHTRKRRVAQREKTKPHQEMGKICLRRASGQGGGQAAGRLLHGLAGYFRERIMPMRRSEPLMISSGAMPVLTTESRLVTALRAAPCGEHT